MQVLQVRRPDYVAYARLKRNLATFEERTQSFNEALFRFRERVAAERSPTCPLNDRERTILNMIAVGRENAEIAAELHFALGTIKLHVREILRKLGASSRTEAAVIGVRKGYL